MVLVAACALLAPLLAAAPAQASTVLARGLLMTLPVRTPTPTGYSRTLFSNGRWVDADHDCQDTRAEVLIKETHAPVTYTTSRHCYLKTGRWYSWYDAKTYTTASSVQIDHVVPVAEAWASGAKTWTSTDRTQFYNDLGYAWTLDAVSSAVNESKGDRDPAHWLPPLASARCAYAIHWVAIKYRWRLAIDTTEKPKLSSLLSGTCGAHAVTVPPRAR